MNKSAGGKYNSSSSATHHTLQKSSTLNRHYVKRPGAYLQTEAADAANAAADAANEVAAAIISDAPAADSATSGAIKVNFGRAAASERREALIAEMKAEQQEAVKKHRMKINITQIDNSSDLEEQVAAQAEPAPLTIPVEDADQPPAPNPYQAALDSHRAAPQPAVQFNTAHAAKERAIEAALSQAAKPAAVATPAKAVKSAKAAKSTKLSKKALKAQAKASKKSAQQGTLAKAMHRQARAKNTGKFILAFATSAACVAVLGYLVHLNMPDISVRVAAMQTGIEASYPNYIPRDYQLSAVTTDKDSRVVMDFSHPDGSAFTLTEESSSWDSSALLNNYVKLNYGTDFTILREQGITIYISPSSDATWVNGGIRYTLDVTAGSLTKTQIKNLVTSL